MKKNLKRLVSLFLLICMFSAQSVFAQMNGGIGEQSHTYLETEGAEDGIVATDPNYVWGLPSTRWAKGYFTDLDISGIFTFGGTAGSDLDMDGYDIDNAGNINITVADTDNQVGISIAQNDVTNNPAAFTITNAGSGNDITAPNFSLLNGALATTSINIGGTITLVGTIDDDTMGTATDTNIATSESIKAYVDGMSYAPNDATYITQTANGSLTAEQALGALSSGIMRVATTTGVVSALTDSAGIASNISDETGSGALVFGTSPALSTPTGIIASDIELSEIGTATYDDLQDWSNSTQSAGVIDGGAITDSGSGEIDISAVKGIVKTTNSAIGANVFFDLAGATNQSLTDDSINYIAVDYNSGTPQFVIATSNTANGHTIFNLGKVFREGTTLDIIDSGLNIYDFNKRVQQHHVEESSLHFVSGASVGETGTRNISVSAGVMYAGLNRIATDAINTSVADDFEYYYNDGAWQKSDQTQIDNLQYNNFGTGLATLANNKYGVHWVYKGTGTSTYVIYGLDSYTLAGAQAVQPPASLPSHVEEMGVLRAKIIIEKSAVAFEDIESVDDVNFTASTASNHNELQGLNGGTDDEYYHLTSAEYTGSGTGVFARVASPTFTTPALGTPSALVGTNITGTGASFTAGTVTNGVYTTDNLSALSATTSAQLAGVISDETGSGAACFATAPTFTTSIDITGGADIDADGIDLDTGNTFAINTADVLDADELFTQYWTLDPTPASDDTGEGIKSSVTVDANSYGIGSCLHLDTDGNYIEADADAAATMPCIALALETSTGTKDVLITGYMRNDAWAWTVGGMVYVSTTVGELTQTAPSGAGDQVQAVGIATSADEIRFFPDLTLIEISA